MSASAKIYLAAVSVLGLVLLVGSPLFSGPVPDWTRFSAYLALAVVASGMKVRLPGIEGTISLNFVLYLLAIAQLSLAETVYVVCAGTLVQTVWKSRRRPPLERVIFNVGAVVVSIVPAFVLHQRWPGLPALALAAAVFYTINTALVSTIIALAKSQSVSTIWNRCYLWTLPYYLVGSAVAASVDASEREFGWMISLLVLPIMYMVYRYYRLLVASHVSEATADTVSHTG